VLSVFYGSTASVIIILQLSQTNLYINRVIITSNSFTRKVLIFSYRRPADEPEQRQQKQFAASYSEGTILSLLYFALLNIASADKVSDTTKMPLKIKAGNQKLLLPTHRNITCNDCLCCPCAMKIIYLLLEK